MSRRLLYLALAAVALAPAACHQSSTHHRDRQVMDGSLVKKTLRSYHTIQSQYDGKVGYLKVYDVSEAGGPTYPWRSVYDLDYTELGFIDQFGMAYRYHHYPEIGQEAHDTTVRVDRMPADSTENNVMRMLGLDVSRDDVSFPVASQVDLE